MSRTDFGEMQCSMARALDIVGESWTPLILRDLLVGFTRFEEIREDLGIATNVLTKRLDKLMSHGVVEREGIAGHSKRFAYRLTPKGFDAVPILLELVAWGDRWEVDGDGPPTAIVHTSCGRTTLPVASCGECGEPLRPEDLEYHRGPGSRSAPGTRLLGEHLGAGQPSGC